MRAISKNYRTAAIDWEHLGMTVALCDRRILTSEPVIVSVRSPADDAGRVVVLNSGIVNSSRSPVRIEIDSSPIIMAMS